MSNVNSALSELNGSVQSFQSRVEIHVDNVDVSTKKVHSVAQDIYNKIQEFSTSIIRGEEQQLAHENIMRIDQIIKEQFGNYDAVRKTIMGVVRDFDINLVRNSTIEELSEELWITSSRYWLSYALLAVTAWVNDYPDVASNALMEASRKDAIKTSLFFCLLNLRFDRVDTARKWFAVYCKTLDPVCLQQETAVMIQAYMGGVFGKDKQLEYDVTSITNEWIRVISENAEICDELVQLYVNYFEKFNQQAEFPYDMISAYCSNAEEIKNSYIDASKYSKLIALVESLSVDGVLQTDGNYKSRIDAVLINLINNFDEEEQELKTEQQYFRLVIENSGNTAVAEQQYQEIKQLQGQSYNFGKQMVDWVIYSEDADPQVRKFGLQSTKQWFISALNIWTSNVRERCPLQFGLTIDEWSGVSNGNDLESQRTSLQNYFKNNEFRMIWINTLNILMAVLFFIGLAVTVIAAVITFTRGFTLALPIGLVLMAAGVGVLIARYFSGKKQFEMRSNAAMQSLEGTMAQIAEFRRFFAENTSKKDVIVGKLSYL